MVFIALLTKALIVVVWHWMFAVTHWTAAGALTMPNPISSVPGLWLATWVLQIMPLFFFVGGFANYVAWNANTRKGGPVGRFLTTRLRRLVLPTAALIATWAVVDVTLRSVVPGYTGVLHWGFAVFGGGCCLLFIAAPSPWKPEIPFLALLPQLAWIGFVVYRARVAGLRAWG